MKLIHARAAPLRSPHPHILLAHGASQPVTSPFFETLTTNLVAHGISVHRLTFDYMEGRDQGGPRRPPPRIETLIPAYESAVAATRRIARHGALFIGGKSMGARVASLVAQRLYDTGKIAGLVCLSYPFHPPKKPESLRTAHLETLTCPTLIIQGERDPFGTPEEVEGYGLSSKITLAWCPDGDHDLKPRKSSGETWEGNLKLAADRIGMFAFAAANP